MNKYTQPIKRRHVQDISFAAKINSFIVKCLFVLAIMQNTFPALQTDQDLI